MAKWNKPPALALQLDRCDVCGDKYHRGDLVRTQVEFLDMKAENFFEASSYDGGTYWTVDTASDAGTISYGNRCDNVRTTLSDDNVISYLNGVQTWEGSGVFRAAQSRNLSAGGHITFSAHVGPHEQNTSPEMTVVLGICNSDGSTKQAVKTYTIKGSTRVWFNETKAVLNSYGLGTNDWYFYIQVTNDGKWWVDELQIEANVGSIGGHPENFVRTSGSTVSNQSERTLMTQRKVCPGCAELILRHGHRRYRWRD
jgi:hypothetical protein